MSKTPRTDEHLRMKEENGHVVIVSRDFARQLETELAEARAEIDKFNALFKNGIECFMTPCESIRGRIRRLLPSLWKKRAEARQGHGKS